MGKNRLSLAAEHSLLDNQPLYVETENNRYGHRKFKSQINTPNSELRYGFKPDEKVQRFIRKRIPVITSLDSNEYNLINGQVKNYCKFYQINS
jgi:hypothetical protein